METAARQGASPAVRVRVPGKINLALAVGRRRPDGYHPIATVFHAVSLYDDVVATTGHGVQVEVTGPQAAGVPTDGENSAARAAQLLADRAGVPADVRLRITKAIPPAGGMAGGSADAAATLVACDALWATGLGREELAELAAALGSDVPFLLHGQTAVGRGRGHLISPVLASGEYHWALGMRHIGLSTPAVYSVFDEIMGEGLTEEPEIDPALLRALRGGAPSDVGAALGNDLQVAALEAAPELAEALAVAQDAGALGVVVSGSGPTVAALAGSRRHARSVCAAMLAAGVVDEAVDVTGPVPGARVVPDADAFPDWA